MRDMLEANHHQPSDELVFLHGAVDQVELRNLPVNVQTLAQVTWRAPWFIEQLLTTSDGITGRTCGEVLGIH